MTQFSKVLKILEERFSRDLPAHIKEDPFRVLIGCILSARTKDENTDKAYEALFREFADARSLAQADLLRIQALIKPVNYYKTKAKRIKEAASFIIEKFKGRVPKSRKALMRIPGIGPKCADIVLSYGFGKPTVAVDTHVETVAKRLGVAPERARYEEVKRAIEQATPLSLRARVNDLLVVFGREICHKNNPKCSVCPVFEFCIWEGKWKRVNAQRKAMKNP